MRYMLVILSLLLLSGCTALVVGGAAAGGYQLGKDERQPERSGVGFRDYEQNQGKVRR